MNITPELWGKAVEFHGHACPGLAIGMRMAADSAAYLGITSRSDDEEILCITETDACGVDAVQVLLGCSLGKGNLMLKLRGKSAMTFLHRPTGKACRVSWTKPKFDSPKDQDESIRFILSDAAKTYCTVTPVAEPELPKAFITKSYPCAECGESTAEHMMLSLDGKKYCLDCAPQVSRIIP